MTASRPSPSRLSPSRSSGPTRRALLGAGLVLPLAGCGQGDGRPAAPSPKKPESPSPGVRSRRAEFAALERRHGARLGVYALATGTGATLAHRADERFAFCSTFKTLAAAAVLDGNPLGHLDKTVTIEKSDVNSISPVLEGRIGSEMTLRQLCDAAVRYSDGTAGNLLMRDIGGPKALTAYLRKLGDEVSRMDQYEPELNGNRPQDPRDSSTPRALARDYRKLVLGDALRGERRALLTDWLERSTTGEKRIRAGLPEGWKPAHKTGTGNYGRAHDIAVVRPPDSEPLVLAVMSDRSGYGAEPKEALLADAAELVAGALV